MQLLQCTSHLNRFHTCHLIIDRDNGGVRYGARITPDQEKIDLENLGEQLGVSEAAW